MYSERDQKGHWSTTALGTLHALLCATSLCITLFRYSPETALVHWWISPPDIISLIILTPLFLHAKTSGVAVIVQRVLCLLQVLALGFHTWQNPESFAWAFSITALVAARFLVAGKIVHNTASHYHVRGCAS